MNKLYINTIVALISQILTIICGFVLPRFMLLAYGSTINGLVSSISQFLGVISFMQLGVGAVVQSTLYEPLIKKDSKKISEIYSSASNFFRTIAIIFSIYVVILMFVYPNTVASKFDFTFSFSLIFILAINLFMQYYFGLTNQLLLYADQKAYIPLIVDVISLLLNTFISIFLINNGFSIQIVKICSSIIYIMRPIILSIYVKNKYEINKHITYDEEPIKQKWNGLTQHVASTVMDNTDIMILTVFSSLDNVSIYYVYNLVVFGIRQLVTSLTVGLQSYFGSIYVQYDSRYVKSVFTIIEFIFHFLITVLFTCVILLIVPFVSVYTFGIKDLNYNVPLFAFIISLSQAFYCYRLVYYTMIKAAGHFRQTQKSAVIEMILNITISIFCVVKFGLVGVAIGTLLAVIYRTIYFIYYLHKNIIYIELKKTFFRFSTDILIIVFLYFFLSKNCLSEFNYLSWFILAIKVFIVVLVVTFIFNLLEMLFFERSVLTEITHKISERINKDD